MITINGEYYTASEVLDKIAVVQKKLTSRIDRTFSMSEKELKPEADDTNVWLMAVDKVEIDKKEDPPSGKVDQEDLLSDGSYRIFAKPMDETGKDYRILDKQNLIVSRTKPHESCLWAEIINTED